MLLNLSQSKLFFIITFVAQGDAWIAKSTRSHECTRVYNPKGDFVTTFLGLFPEPCYGLLHQKAHAILPLALRFEYRKCWSDRVSEPRISTTCIRKQPFANLSQASAKRTTRLRIPYSTAWANAGTIITRSTFLISTY
jgi:hypothetical protein